MDDNVHNGDETLLVKFYKEAVYQKAKSEEAGHPVYEDRDFISIIIPGDNTQVINRQASDRDKERFYRQWEKYQRQETETVDGWPVEEWTSIPRSQAEALKHAKFLTVEQIANASDAQCQKIMGGTQLRAKAKAALEAAKDSAAAEKYAAQNEELIREIESLKAEIQRLDEQQKKGRNKAA